jgi:hypothetical protein
MWSNTEELDGTDAEAEVAGCEESTLAKNLEQRDFPGSRTAEGGTEYEEVMVGG